MIKQISYSISLILLLTCCSSEIEIGLSSLNDSSVNIQVIPKQKDLETKSTIYNFYTENISKIKVYRFDGTSLLDQNGLSPIGCSENTILDFTSSFLYPRDNSDIILYSFYPSDIQDTYQSTATNEIAFSISGQDDLMYASAQAGNKRNPIPVNLIFDHKLAQIKFKLKSQITDSLELGSSVSIIATGPNAGTMDLTNGDLHIASVTIGTFTLPTDFTLGQLTANGETEVPGELLLFPQSEYSFSLQIGDSYYPVTFDHQELTTSWNESSVYTLTISINSLSNPKTTPVVKEDI